MLNIETVKEAAKAKYNKTLETLKECEGFEKDVSFVDGSDIFFRIKKYEECIELLHKFAKGRKYKLSHYYYNGSYNLAITYNFGTFDVVFYCNEPEKAIESLGGGKCRTVIKTTENKQIICDL
jgi:hypothetical protein